MGGVPCTKVQYLISPCKGSGLQDKPIANFGYLLEMDHRYGYASSYGHLDGFASRKGDEVQEGQLIATLGNIGKISGPHLHYELRYWGKWVNPAMHTMDILKAEVQLDQYSLTGCETDVTDHRPKIVF